MTVVFIVEVENGYKSNNVYYTDSEGTYSQYRNNQGGVTEALLNFAFRVDGNTLPITMYSTWEDPTDVDSVTQYFTKVS